MTAASAERVALPHNEVRHVDPPGVTPTRPDAFFRIHLVVGVLLSIICTLLPISVGRDVLYTVISYGCVAMMCVGIRRNKPTHSRGWWLVAGGMAIWAMGDLLWAVYTWGLDISPEFSLADVFYLASYVVMAAGFWSFVQARRRDSDREGLIDAAIFTVGSVLISWVVLMRPGLEAAEASAGAQVLATAYPLGDLLLLALLVCLLTSQGARTPAFRWLVAANALLLVADSAYQYTAMRETPFGPYVSLAWLLGYVCFTAAALHPSMRQLTDSKSGDFDTRFTRGRLAALTAASLVAPGTLLLQLALGLRLEAWAVALSSVVLFLLVVWRMSGLLRHLDAQASQLADLARTDALTGLPNRRTSDAELARMQNRARSEGIPLCVAVLDLDHFKKFNDTFGHQAGDNLLMATATAWQERLGQAQATAGPGHQALLGRWGGEEFVLLLMGHDQQDAVRLVEALAPATPAGQSFSAGVARWDGLESATDVFARADQALYAAKTAGRAQVCAAESLNDWAVA
ncbi:hypothetical protein Kisp01_23040 [Kineosporia sp. NBRC 101677]|uniref:GGDEF domain-containing protein n=1 Tax=Kineosporia sp. NBRC 101677 TaxID=3032197 RepID=UPI0024A35D7D|nr:GGDEF domain-containing protein [Kineosporia sp. NBRC 101677]GLY15289.1 hypothetical protein Kisp01_23040 [Kineosporia sp. NBRC 101677]